MSGSCWAGGMYAALRPCSCRHLAHAHIVSLSMAHAHIALTTALALPPTRMVLVNGMRAQPLARKDNDCTLPNAAATVALPTCSDRPTSPERLSTLYVARGAQGAVKAAPNHARALTVYAGWGVRAQYHQCASAQQDGARCRFDTERVLHFPATSRLSARTRSSAELKCSKSARSISVHP